MGTLTPKTDAMILYIGIVLCLFAVVSFCFFIVQRRKMRREMETVLQRLDDALAQKRQTVVYDETMDSAIAERLDKLVKMMERITQQTREEVSSVRALVSNISHQVKTPLTNIILYTELLQENMEKRKEQELARKVTAQAEKLDFFIQQLVKSAYAEIEMLQLMPEKCPVDELLRKVCQVVELAALKKHIVVEREQTDLFAVFDMKWSTEGVGNILDNAIKYSPENSIVRVSAISYESFVCIQVEDEGTGIPENEQGLVFQRFYRSEKTKDKPGLGIGLYLAREIFSREGGYVKIDSAKGCGTIFKIFLPRF